MDFVAEYNGTVTGDFPSGKSEASSIKCLAIKNSLSGSYKLVEDDTGFRRAVRPVLFEDRVLGVEQKFFCDRTTEKTVTLTVWHHLYRHC